MSFENEAKKENKNTIPAVERTVEIIELLSGHEGPMRFEDILKMTNLPRSTVFRILSTLERNAYVEKIEHDDGIKWRIGRALFKLGLNELAKLDIRTEAYPIMKALSDQTNEYVQLGQLFRGMVIYIEHIKRLNQLSMYTELGSLLHINLSASGMVLASHLSDVMIDQIIQEHGLPRNTDKTITDPEEMKAYLRKVREQGYAIDDEMYAKGIRCIAAPIYDYSGKNVAAVGITGFASNISGPAMDRKIRQVIEAAEQISAKLGYVKQKS